MHASEIMSAPVYVIEPAENVARARNLMFRHGISRLLVVTNDMLTGIITKKDLAYRLRQSEPSWRRRPIDQIPVSVLMVTDPITIAPDTTIRDVARLMVNEGVSSLPVVEEGTLIGIVTKSDLMRSSLVGRIRGAVGDLMEDVTTVSRYHSLDHVVNLISERNDKLVVINNDGTLAGIITESNLAFFEYAAGDVLDKDVTMLRKEVPAGRKAYRHVRDVTFIAEDVMSSPVETIGADSLVGEAVARMRERAINSLVVAENDELIGILKRDDIIREVAR
ncbi:CBS domain-containing protein [Methanosphaerula subterraneus]|uniref:CBS domain-containing protein n=1 Tax=Methanosphaerula subterraneus TaxID=3350244 RepID=UPI003F84FE35